jgi:hypothetical protein
MPVAERLNICSKYRFLVEIDGIVRAAFREVEGIDRSNVIWFLV